MKTLMRNGRDRRSENPSLGHAKKERVSLFGTDQRITSGPAARRPHSKAEYMTAPERFADSQIPLAPRAPSIHGPYAAAFRLPAHAKKAHVLFVQFLISAMMTSSSFAGIGKVDRYGPFIHSGLDRPNHELNAFSAAEASASLAFAATEAFPSRQV
jgi:hypothetical protein